MKKFAIRLKYCRRTKKIFRIESTGESEKCLKKGYFLSLFCVDYLFFSLGKGVKLFLGGSDITGATPSICVVVIYARK